MLEIPEENRKNRVGPAAGHGAATSAGAASLEFRGVTKRYGRGEQVHNAVNDLSFEVPAGAICVLVGPSGCGKTTSLKMVNRLIEPTAGEILLDGVNVLTEHVTELRRRIGYVIQQVGLFPHLTVGRNVAVVPALVGWSKERQRARADELLSLVGLDPANYRNRYPYQLSGGERQRVGVARALAADPPLMLMDEPFAAVDPIVRERLQDEFLRLQRDLAKTILFVTHDIDEAIKMGDFVAVMEEGGRLAQFGPPDEILAHPASDFVARFVGADRGLKRLSLVTIADLELEPVAASARAELPMFVPSTKLRDALSVLLAADSRGGVALDDEGRPRGFVTVDAIAHALADDYPGRSHASAAEGDAKVAAADHASAAEGDAEIAGPGGDS
ncbi:MAG TPA: ABC transporter ATP-binding protein [Candidatus Limnocylindrales bacterium]